ncbi:NHS-like protein 2 isoform X2 [Pleurodeles waltl]|uniref:NHS-like protein 2 isoform X2 n=1 Tax=Pleurodeles waltl TaxID=8319 RepID=UPI0037094AEF
MPFYRRTVSPGRLCPPRPGGPELRDMGDVCSLALHSVLYQLADLSRHSLFILGDIECHLKELRGRTRSLELRMGRMYLLLSGSHMGRRRPTPPRGSRPQRTDLDSGPGGATDGASVAGWSSGAGSDQPRCGNSSAGLGTATGCRAGANLDQESKKAVHSKVSWQQPVNVFLSSNRLPCVEELHQEAQLNLQSLMQDEYEERYLDTPLTSQTFRYSEHSPAPELTPDTTPKHSAKRLEFVYLPDTRRVSEDETTTVGVRPRESCFSLPATPDKQVTWSKAFPLPTLEERKWHQSNSIQTNVVPINVSGNSNAVTPTNNPASSAEAHSTPIKSEAAHARHPVVHAVAPQPLPHPLRKTHSDLGRIVQSHTCPSLARMDSAAMMYANPACNGSRDAAFPPPWQEDSFSYMSPSNPPVTPNNQVMDNVKCSAECNSKASLNLTSPASGEGRDSFFMPIKEPEKNNGSGLFTCSAPVSPMVTSPRPEDSKLTFLPSHQEEEDLSVLRADENACTYRERSLSMPTDSGSLSSVDIVFSDNRRGSGNYALSYPSGSSEESTSTENISIGAEQEDLDKRCSSRNISLKKAKKKPSPPTRSVSLIKDGNVQKTGTGVMLSKEQRPKSLCISFDNQDGAFAPSDSQDNGALPVVKDAENMHLTHHWYLSDWKAGDPYRSLSGSSTATGTTVIECIKTRGSSESLTSLSISRATTPSQLSAEPESKISSPGRPPALMSPSSGYSSQSETPTPTIPASMILGHSPYQTCKVRPLVPERKSSLPAASPIEKSPKSRLPFELPITPPTHLDLSSLRMPAKGKTRVSRHYSDSTFGIKIGPPKTSPVQPVMPMVTQSDLRSVRLRSVSKSEPEDNIDGIDIPEEQPEEVFHLPEKKVKPPVAEKPPMCKRPQNLTQKTHSMSQESLTASPTFPQNIDTGSKEKTLHHDIYTVIRKPKHKKNQEAKNQTAVSPSGEVQESFFTRVPTGMRDSQRCGEEKQARIKYIPERIIVQSMGDQEKKKVKIPPPIPKKPSVVYIPTTSPPTNQAASTTEQRLTPSPIITVEKDTVCFPEISNFPLPDVTGNCAESSNAGMHNCDASSENSPNFNASENLPSCNFSGSSTDVNAETSHVIQKTADSIVEDDDDVFVASRTTEDLFTVIHRSKRKLLGWKEPGDTFGNRSSSHSPVKNTPVSPTNESPSAAGSMVKSSSKNEDFKALLQRKGSKTSLGARTSAAELLKSTNPLARRVMNEFAQDIENNNSGKTQP